MEINFHGKRALVTGASQGIGRHIATKLSECGALVVAMDQKEPGLKTLKEQIPSVEYVCLDLSDWEATKKAAEDCGPIDLLVNCAGVTSLQPVGEIDEETVDLVFGINVKAVINLSQVITNGMRKRKAGGAIVNISSQSGTIAMKNHVTYNASKSAVNMITKCMALDLGPYQIRTNAVNPTAVNTEMGRFVFKDPADKAVILNRIPLGRFAETVEIVDVVLFLLSDKASMINGACVPVDGGSTAC